MSQYAPLIIPGAIAASALHGQYMRIRATNSANAWHNRGQQIEIAADHEQNPIRRALLHEKSRKCRMRCVYLHRWHNNQSLFSAWFLPIPAKVRYLISKT